jgi:hypothetical protein
MGFVTAAFSPSAIADSISAAEYYIDTDPGEGSGVAVAAADGAFDSAEEALVLADIDVSYLPPGHHRLFLRVKDSQERWGVIREVPFEIYTPVTIAGAEYFIDTDPGPGNGIALDPADGSFYSNEESVALSGIDVTDLDEGIHTLYVRFEDQLGRWGSTRGQEFTVDNAPDTDEDGIPDYWENYYGLDPDDPDDALLDPDNDGLTNLAEYQNQTDPLDADSDSDGMSDGWEVLHGFSPADDTDATLDPDNDDLNNLAEFENNTDPHNPDTDGDGISDGDEVNHGNNPSGADNVSLEIQGGDVVVSLTGDNTVFIEVSNGFFIPKTIQFELTGIDEQWYTIASEDTNFTLLPFAHKVIPVQLHLPMDCDTTVGFHEFEVAANWQHAGLDYTSNDLGNLVITPNPNIVRPFVANLDLQPIASTPGMMTYSFTLINYGDTLTDIEVFVDDDSALTTWMDKEYHQSYRLAGACTKLPDLGGPRYQFRSIHRGH